MLLRHYLTEGLSVASIARQLGLSERTIRRWIAAGELDRDLDGPPRYGPRGPVEKKLDPFIDLIAQRLEAYPDLSSVRLLEEIRELGYSGGYTQLCVHVRGVRPRPPLEPVVRFETPAGRQGQVDFAEFRFPWGRRHALVVVLGYSRLLWLHFVERQDMRSLIRGLEAAFAYFGGVPCELLFDQMKTVITGDLRLLGRQLAVNQEFVRFAAHWGFKTRACRPYRAQTKGKVERPIHYVRTNFVYGRDFIGDEHLAEECERWLERANARVHATTKEMPRLRFERDEQALLLPLAATPYRSPILETRERKPTASRIQVPAVSVEKRPLEVYAQLVEAGA